MRQQRATHRMLAPPSTTSTRPSPGSSSAARTSGLACGRRRGNANSGGCQQRWLRHAGRRHSTITPLRGSLAGLLMMQ